MESLVANNVTSQPRETSPSVMLLATVSHAPYCRGGVRQATGARTATRLGCIVYLQIERSLHPRHRVTGIPSSRRVFEILIEAGDHGHVAVRHRQTASRIVPAPADA